MYKWHVCPSSYSKNESPGCYYPPPCPGHQWSGSYADGVSLTPFWDVLWGDHSFFFALYFRIFFEHHLGYFSSLWVPLWFILAAICFNFGCPGLQKWSPNYFQQAKTPNFHTVEHFSLFLWSPRLRKSYQNGDKIFSELMSFARCILEATFSCFVQVLTRRLGFWKSLRDSRQQPTNQVFRLFFDPGVSGG